MVILLRCWIVLQPRLGKKSYEWLETRSSASSDIMTDVLQDGCFGVDCCFRFSLLTGHVSVT